MPEVREEMESCDMFMWCDENMDGNVDECERFNCAAFTVEFMCAMEYEKSGYECLMNCHPEVDQEWCADLSCEEEEWITAAHY